MKGLELSRRYYETWGRPMIRDRFPDLEPYLAVGLAGSGSECLGYDDTVSGDHDFGPGFCIWLPGEELVDRKAAFALERAYAALPAEFEGCRRPLLDPVGGARRGVIRMADFFLEKTGSPDGRLTPEEWLHLPASSLGEAVNGAVFADPLGQFSEIRARLSTMPRDVRRKRLAGHLLLMAQSGQYNYQRCLDHGEAGSAQLAAVEFVRSALSCIFLLNDRYEPFYKWVFRALRDLPLLAELEPDLVWILTAANDPETSFEKYARMEAVSGAVIRTLRTLGLTELPGSDPEQQAYALNNSIADGQLRNLHILSGV